MRFPCLDPGDDERLEILRRLLGGFQVVAACENGVYPAMQFVDLRAGQTEDREDDVEGEVAGEISHQICFASPRKAIDQLLSQGFDRGGLQIPRGRAFEGRVDEAAVASVLIAGHTHDRLALDLLDHARIREPSRDVVVVSQTRGRPRIE